MRCNGLTSLMLVLLSGCSVFARTTDRVTVTANESEAILFADGARIGTGTAVVDVKSNENHVFTALLGSRKASDETSTHVSTTGMIDGIFGFVLLVPWIGLATPGAHEVDRTSILLVLPPE